MIHILVIMLIRGSAPRCVGMSAREALPPRLGPVSGCIYKKRFTCGVTQKSVTRKFSVLKDIVLYVRNIFILLQSYYKFPKRTRNERKIFWSLLAIPPNPPLDFKSLSFGKNFRKLSLFLVFRAVC